MTSLFMTSVCNNTMVLLHKGILQHGTMTPRNQYHGTITPWSLTPWYRGNMLYENSIVNEKEIKTMKK